MILGIINIQITLVCFIIFVESVNHSQRDSGIVILYIAYVFG